MSLVLSKPQAPALAAALASAPSALASRPAPSTSAKYTFIDTREVVARLADEGYVVSSARQASPRKRDPLFTRHMLEFRRPEDQELHQRANLGTVPRILFTNSHDGSSAATVRAGLYRFVCSNGLVVGRDVAMFTARHAADAAADVIQRVRELARQTDRTYQSIERWQAVDLSAAQREEFARMAATLRWGHPDLFEAEQLLRPRRAEDDAGDLWSVFNRVQENAMRGGMVGLTQSGRRNTARPLADIGRELTFNGELWELAEEFAG